MEIILKMDPVPKGRPRTRFLKNPIKSGKHKGATVLTYTPEKTVAAEEEIKWLLKLSHAEDFYPAGTPIKLEATFYRSRPKSNKDDLPTQKPDWDNYGKLLTDALEKELYDNDSQITTAIIRKRYTRQNENNRIYFKLTIDHIEDDF